MTARVDVVVMAHPRREAYIPELLASLDRPAQVVWDRRNDRWDTGSRAWQAVDRTASHGLVLQDDAIACRDLVAGVERALAHVPEDTPLGLYCGRVRPHRDLVQQLVDRAGDASWLTMGTLNWGPGIVLPTKWIDDMIAWADGRTDVANYDKRISRWLGHQGIRTYYPWPSLVEHRLGPSLVPGRNGNRHAHRFLGADQSALDCDWTGATVTIPELSPTGRYVPRYRPYAAPTPRIQAPKLGVAVKFVSKKYPELQVPRARVRFRGGVAATRDPDAVAELLKPQYRQLGVEPVDEPQPDDDTAVTDAGKGDPVGRAPADADPDVGKSAEPEGGQSDDGSAGDGEAPNGDGELPDGGTSAPPADGVPTGGAKEVLAWVGDDPVRARQALDAENARDKPRSTLAATLTKLAG